MPQLPPTASAIPAPVTRTHHIPKHQWIPSLLAAVAALVLYAVTLGGTYIYDDVALLKEDPRLTHQDSHGHFDQWRLYWTQDYMPGAVDKLYRPLTCISFAVQYALHGDRPWLYHLVNWLLHAAVSAGVAELARRILGFSVACVAGLLFAVHPVHVEAVAGLVGRAELLCTLAAVWAMILFVRPITARRCAAICILFAVALLSKEQGILLPAMLLAMLPLRREMNRHATSDNARAEGGSGRLLVALLCMITAAYLIVREQMLGFTWDRRMLDWTANPLIRASGSDVALMPLVLLGRYLLLLVAPLKLSLDYGTHVIGWAVDWRQPYFYLGAIAVIGWVTIALWSWHRRRWAILFCAVALALSYGMVSNAVILIGTIFGERLMYLPSVFFVILAAALLVRLPRRRLLMPLAAVLVLAASVRTFTYARLWNDPLALYLHDLRQFPQSMHLHGLATNQYLIGGDFRKAREIGEDSRRRLPDCWQSYLMCVEPDLRMEDYADAERVLAHVDPRCPPLRIAQLRRQVEEERARSAHSASSAAH